MELVKVIIKKNDRRVNDFFVEVAALEKVYNNFPNFKVEVRPERYIETAPHCPCGILVYGLNGFRTTGKIKNKD